MYAGMGGFIAQLAQAMCCLENLMHLSGEAKKHMKPALSLCPLWLELPFLG